MGRTFKPGISYYRMDCGHITNKKVRLLFNEFGGDGYYIWHAILDYAYANWGYYFDLNNSDELELFATEYCKMKATLVDEVIKGCVRRDLFDRNVLDVSNVLTSDMMQETFLIATSERRLKGTRFDMYEQMLLLDFTDEVPRNIAIVPGNYKIDRRKNRIIPGNNPHIREDNSKEEDSKVEKIVGASPPKSADLSNNSGEKSNSSAEEKSAGAKKNIPPQRDVVIAFFKAAVGQSNVVNPWPEDKCYNQACQFFDHYTANGWVQGRGKKIKDWQAAARLWIRNEMAGTFKAPERAPAPVAQEQREAVRVPRELHQIEKGINFMYESFLEGRVNQEHIEPLQYDYLKRLGVIDFGDEDRKRIQTDAANLKPAPANEIELVNAMKRIGVIELFKVQQTNGAKTLFSTE